jgi:hypothetical protein
VGKIAVDYAGLEFSGLLPSKRAEAVAIWRSDGSETAAAILQRARALDRLLELTTGDRLHKVEPRKMFPPRGKVRGTF